MKRNRSGLIDGGCMGRISRRKSSGLRKYLLMQVSGLLGQEVYLFHGLISFKMRIMIL